MPSEQKLIYILNHYSVDSDSHFNHIVHLLREMAALNTKIALIIEKAEDIPGNLPDNIAVFPIHASKWKRAYLLFRHLLELNKKGYKTIYIRISWVAALIAIISSKFTGQKNFFWLSGQGTIEHYRSLAWGLEKIKMGLSTILPFRIIKKHIDYFVTGPESMATYFHQQRGVSFDKIKILYNDIDLNRFHQVVSKEKIEIRNQLDIPIHSTVVLFVHYFSRERKTVYYIPYILDQFFENHDDKDVLFILIGSGPEQETINMEIEKKNYKRQVKFLGSIPNQSIDMYFKMADLFIQPTYAEGFPRTLLEAMACGLPFVSTNAGGIADLIGPKQGSFIVDVKNRKLFAEKLSALYSDIPLQRELKEENIHTVTRFSTQKVAKMYIDVLFKTT
jgi:glycosyltransferase involved in cell wall biosynthesis